MKSIKSILTEVSRKSDKYKVTYIPIEDRGGIKIYRELDNDQNTQISITTVRDNLTEIKKACIADANKEKYTEFKIEMHYGPMLYVYPAYKTGGVWHWEEEYRR